MSELGKGNRRAWKEIEKKIKEYAFKVLGESDLKNYDEDGPKLYRRVNLTKEVVHRHSNSNSSSSLRFKI